MADKTGKPGGQRVYSDMAIETGLVVRMVYKLAYRQTEGFLHSIASLLGLGIEIPDYSTLSRRSRLLRKKLRIPKAASNQPIHLMIDSTGLRIHVGTARKLPWCINTGKSLIPLTLRFLAQKRNLLIPLELSRVMHQGSSPVQYRVLLCKYFRIPRPPVASSPASLSRGTMASCVAPP